MEIKQVINNKIESLLNMINIENIQAVNELKEEAKEILKEYDTVAARKFFLRV